ncbi:hypothetical protein OCI51_26025 (plasmid) [Lysinibacillus capsici]|uniref:hypothetical protein n=1 Tax=Lysinibacillus capsici TaxID=2115968 RepID=UPI0021D8115C|nr:hypothetical protein [Lysinibacillus capsici]UYB50118.1 hypothetical protein OCI51_26025 [Lysinibacillus capsici]
MVVTIAEIKKNIVNKEIEVLPEIKKADDFLYDFNAYTLEEIECEIELVGLIQDSGTMLNIIAQQSEPELIKGYKENYFNEIIQNANDLSVGTEITFEMERINEVYSCTAVYDDPGFKVSNIVSFCNRGLSDKKRHEQTGKYGVGIKSLFAFVDNFEMKNNIEIKINPRNRVDNLTPLKLSYSNPKKTTLHFSFTRKQPEEIFDFNIGKLANFIDRLEGSYPYGVEDYFVANLEDRLIFDAKSLLFMDAKKKSDESTINTIVFYNKTAGNHVKIHCEKYGKEKISEELTMTLCEITINIQIGSYLSEKIYKYALFELEKIRVAIPYEEIGREKNKYFSTFFVKLDEGDEQSFWNINAAIHTEYANLSRTDFADSSKDRENVMKVIKENLQELVAKMTVQHETLSPEYKIVLSEIFHKLLINDRHESESTLFDLVIARGLTNRYLVKEDTLCSDIAIVERKPNEKVGYQKVESLFVGNYEETIEQVKWIFNEEVKSRNPFEFLDVLLAKKGLLENVKAAYTSNNLSNVEYLTILNKYDCLEDLVIATLEKQRVEELSATVSDYLVEKYKDKFQELLVFFGAYSLIPGIDHNGYFKSYKGQFKDVLFRKNSSSSNKLNEMIMKDYKRYESIKLKLASQYYKNTSDNSNQLIFIRPDREGTWDRHYVLKNYETPSSENLQLNQNEWALFFNLLIEDSTFREKIVKVNDNEAYLGMWKITERKWRGDVNRFKEGNRLSVTDEIISFNFIKNIPIQSLDVLKVAHQAISNFSKDIQELLMLNLMMKLKWFDFISKFIPWYVGEANNTYQKQIFIEIEDSTLPGNSIDSKFASLIRFHSDIDVETYKLNSSTKLTTAFIWENEFYVKKMESEESFTLVGTVHTHTRSNKLIVLYSQKDVPNDAIVAVLKYMKKELSNVLGLNDDILKYFEHYIPLKPIGMSVDSNIYQNILKVEEYQYNDVNYRALNEIDMPRLSYDDSLAILAAKGSYNKHCPCCGKHLKKLSHLSVCTLPLNNSTQQYIIVPLCLDCEQSFRETLLYVSIQDNILEIITKYYADTSDFTKKYYRIPLSPANNILNQNASILLNSSV